MLNIIVAPNEHNSVAQRRAKRIVKYLKTEQVEYSVYFSKGFDNLKNNVKELLSIGESEFVVVGDDAVLNAVVSCVKDLSKIKIGLIPISKKDDFSSYLGINPNPIQAIKDILERNVESVDVLVVNEMPVLNTVSIGASVEVFNQFKQYKLKNFITHKFAQMKSGNNFSGVELSIEGKGKIRKETVFELVVANGGVSKGNRVSPLSNVQDGLFNVNYSVVSGKKEKKKYIKLFKKGDHIYQEDTKQFWMNKIKITNPEKKIKALIDGEIYIFEELNISIIEKGLKVYKNLKI